MAFKTFSGWFGYSPSSTPSAAQLESRNGVLLLPQDSVVIVESRRGEKKVGEGTFAKVYVGMHMGKERAIKVFHLSSDSTLDQALEEYEKLNSLKHPNIVRVYGMWKDSYKGRNAPAIVMELCDHSLHEYIQQYHPRGSITREHKLKILHDITCAMVYLHSQNIIHGDLRSPNVLIKRNKDELIAKLTDFGMAQVLDPQSNSHITSNVGDGDSLPPEVFNHKEQRDRMKNWAKLTTQVDVFMFGPIAIELACGEFPRPGLKHEVRKGVVTRTYSEIERREQYLTKVKASDRAITDVIVKECLGENPEDRGTFLDLQRIVKGFQRQKDQPGSADHFQVLYEEAQEELEGMRSLLEADQKSLYQQVQFKEKVEEIATLQKECEVTVTQLNEVKEKQDQTQGELEMQKYAWQTLQQEYSKKVFALADQTEKHQRFTEEHRTLVLDHRKMTEEHQKLIEKNNTLELDHCRVKEEYTDHIMQLEDTVRLGNEERTRFAVQLSAEKATCSQTEAELEKLKEKVTGLETVLRGSGKQSEVFKHESQKKDEETTLLKQKGEDTEAQLTLKLSQVEEQRDIAQRKLGDLEQASENSRKDFQVKVQELQKQFDELKHDRSTLLFKLQQTQSDYAIEQKNCNRERDTTKGLRTEVAQLKDSLSSLDAHLKAKDNRIASLNQKCSAAKAELGEQLSEAQSKLKMLESVNEELQDNYDKQTTTLGDLRLQHGDLQDQHRNLEEKRSNYEDRIKQLQKANQASNGERINLSDQLKEEKAKYEQIVEELNRQLKEAKHSPAQTTKMDLGDRLESLELKLRLKEEKVTELRATIEQNEVTVQQRCQMLEKDYDREKEAVRRLKATNALLTKEKQVLESNKLAMNSELNHTGTELTSTLAELNNTQDGLKKAQEQNEASSSRCQELEQQCQELRQHIAELESVQDRLQKREEDLNQQAEVLKSERDTAQRQAQDFDRDGRDLKLKLQKTQSDYENEQENCDRERDTTQGLKSEISQLIDRISTLEREVQALKDKGRHRREVMQQVVKLLQTQVAAVRSDLDQERSRQSDLKDSVEQLLTRSYIVRFLKTELVSRAAELQKCRVELQKCRDELKTTTAERDRLNQSETSAASQVSMQQQLHQFQEHVTQSLGQVHDRVAKVAADVSAVPELNRGVQQLHRQMSSSTSLDQSNVSGQQLTSRSLKLESAIDSEEHLDSNLMTSDASSDVPITGQQWTLSLARLQPTPEEDPGLDLMRTNSPDVSRMDLQPAISHYRQPSASDCHQPSASDHQQPSASDRHQPSVNDRDPQSFRDHPPRPWSEDNMDPLLINAPNPSLPTRIAGQRTHFSNVASYSAFPFQSNPMSFGGFHLVPVPMSFPTTSVMPIHDNPSPMSLPSSSGSPFPMHGGRDSSLSATVATSLQDSVDPALLKKRITKLSELMPYVPDLAHKVPQIAGYLDMYTKLQALKQTCSDPEIHLQELLSQWLEGQEDEERPHYWEYFITLVKAVDQYPVVRRIYIDLAAGQTKS